MYLALINEIPFLYIFVVLTRTNSFYFLKTVNGETIMVGEISGEYIMACDVRVSW